MLCLAFLMYPCDFLLFLSHTDRYSSTNECPSSYVCYCTLVLRDIHHVFMFWVMTTCCFRSIKQLVLDICTQWRTVARPTSSHADSSHSPANQCSPVQPAGFVIKATLQKVLFPFTSVLQSCCRRNTCTALELWASHTEMF